MLLGRDREEAVLAGALARGGEGRGRVVLLHGPRGAGATALLDSAAARATGWRVLRARAARDEVDIAWAVLAQLLDTVVDDAVEALTEAQRCAVDVVVGRRAPGADDVPPPLAVHRLVRELARARPVLLLVDDAQWCDEASLGVLRFLGRRVGDAPVVLALAQADSGGPLVDPSEWSGALDVVPLAPLDADEGAAWVRRDLPDLDPVVADQLVDLAGGLPRRLADLLVTVRTAARGTGADRPGAPGPFDLAATATPSAVRARAQLSALGPGAATALACAHLVPRSTPGALARAAAGLGVDERVVAELHERGLLGLDAGRVVATDRLLAAVAASAAPAGDVVRARRAWSGVLAADDPVEALRQRALAGPGPDEEAASALRARAEALQGVDAAAAGELFELAARVAPAVEDRETCTAWAAELAWMNGRTRRADDLVAALGPPTTTAGRGAGARLLAVRALLGGRPAAAEDLLREAVRDLAATCPDRAVATAAFLALLLGRHPDGLGLPAGALDALPPGHREDVRLVGVVARPWQEHAPHEHQAAFTRLAAVVAADALPAHRLLAWSAVLVGREAEADDAAVAALAAGPRGLLAADLHLARCVVASVRGSVAEVSAHLAAADACAPDVAVVGEIIDRVRAALGRVASVAGIADGWSGAPSGPRAAPTGAVASATNGETAGAVWAAAHARRRAGDPRSSAALMGELWPAAPRQPGAGALLTAVPLVAALVEAGAPCSEVDRVLEEVSAWSHGSASALARASWLLCRAASSPDAAEQETLLRRAADVVGAPQLAARASLSLGMLLRRTRRGVLAREPLERAAAAFAAAGYLAMEDVARRELDATAPRRPGRPLGSPVLTAQERRTAGLAADGLTNDEIARSLEISPRTVAHHLQRVYAKLQVSGRRELPDRLRAADRGAAPPALARTARPAVGSRGPAVAAVSER